MQHWSNKLSGHKSETTDIFLVALWHGFEILVCLLCGTLSHSYVVSHRAMGHTMTVLVACYNAVVWVAIDNVVLSCCGQQRSLPPDPAGPFGRNTLWFCNLLIHPCASCWVTMIRTTRHRRHGCVLSLCWLMLRSTCRCRQVPPLPEARPSWCSDWGPWCRTSCSGCSSESWSADVDRCRPLAQRTRTHLDNHRVHAYTLTWNSDHK